MTVKQQGSPIILLENEQVHTCILLVHSFINYFCVTIKYNNMRSNISDCNKCYAFYESITEIIKNSKINLLECYIYFNVV